MDDADLVLIVFGASAITDRRDVIPAAIEAIGGRIERFGMPVDPGNLLLLAERHGAPNRFWARRAAPGRRKRTASTGCSSARSAGVPASSDDIRTMGVGGLLMEIPTRPQPREPRD